MRINRAKRRIFAMLLCVMMLLGAILPSGLAFAENLEEQVPLAVDMPETELPTLEPVEEVEEPPLIEVPIEEEQPNETDEPDPITPDDPPLPPEAPETEVPGDPVTPDTEEPVTPITPAEPGDTDETPEIPAKKDGTLKLSVEFTNQSNLHESYRFEISGPNGYRSLVTLNSNNGWSEPIRNLSYGTYTIREMGNVSLGARFNDQVILSSSQKSLTVSILKETKAPDPVETQIPTVVEKPLDPIEKEVPDSMPKTDPDVPKIPATVESPDTEWAPKKAERERPTFKGLESVKDKLKDTMKPLQDSLKSADLVVNEADPTPVEIPARELEMITVRFEVAVREEPIQVKLYHSTTGTESTPVPGVDPITLDGDMRIAEWSGLPKLNGEGEIITYSVYKVDNGFGTLMAENPLFAPFLLMGAAPQQAETERTYTYTKAWGEEEEKPDGLSLQLIIDDVPYGEEVLVDEGNGWTYTWTGLPLDGEIIVKETEVSNSMTTSEGMDRRTGRGRSTHHLV